MLSANRSLNTYNWHSLRRGHVIKSNWLWTGFGISLSVHLCQVGLLFQWSQCWKCKTSWSHKSDKAFRINSDIHWFEPNRLSWTERPVTWSEIASPTYTGLWCKHRSYSWGLPDNPRESESPPISRLIIVQLMSNGNENDPIGIEFRLWIYRR